ncbi:Heme O synthase, protoheme IX farnesyltransferase COX10-CtaB [hydrothermal vent metagenome]|uniref:Protoheme IX farnesyltransferase n=1 Tax=hydrothermal vent metagenome TaxID=652676 RepID=A0A3B0XB35_9ZZZZ
MTDIVLNAGRFNWRKYYNLCKPKVVFLIVFTAIVGMLLSTPGALPLVPFLAATIGIGLASASGAALNHWVDQRIDVVMERTSNRPLPQGELSSRSALIFALMLAGVSMLILILGTNMLTALLTLTSLVGYAVIYTMYLKRTTAQNIVLGGAAGAAPPLLGWAAMTGDVNGEALLLFLIIFVWTPPHFWALAIKRKEEYAKAGLPMLPVTHGVPFTKLHILLYTFMLFSVTLMPFVIQMTGLIYFAGALALGAGFIYHAVKLYRTGDSDVHSMKTFSYSIFYLSALFAFLLLDHYARILFRLYM